MTAMGAGALLAPATATGRVRLAEPIDPSFGWRQTGVSADNNGRVTALVPTAGGRMLLVGWGDEEGSIIPFATLFGPRGALDSTFGVRGMYVAPEAYESISQNAALDLADGRFAIAGGTSTNSQAKLGVRFLLPNGHPDQRIGEHGVSEMPVAGSEHAEGAAIARAGAGGVVVGGFAKIGSESRLLFAAFRADGRPDPSFGTGGMSMPVVPGTTSAEVHGLVARGDGTWWVVGGAEEEGTKRPLVLVARLRSDGSLDPSIFGGRGVMTMRVPVKRCSSRCADADYGTARSAVRSLYGGSERLTVAVAVGPTSAVAPPSFSYLRGPPERFVLFRMDSEGRLDQGFGRGGRTDVEFGTSARGLVMAGRGDGFVTVAGGAGDRYALARVDPRGRLDQSFGGTGRSCFEPPLDDAPFTATALASQSGNRVAVAGWAPSSGAHAIGLGTHGAYVTRVRSRFVQAATCFDFAYRGTRARLGAVLARRLRLGLLIERQEGRSRFTGLVRMGRRGPGVLHLERTMRLGGRPLRPDYYNATLVELSARGRLVRRLTALRFRATRSGNFRLDQPPRVRARAPALTSPTAPFESPNSIWGLLIVIQPVGDRGQPRFSERLTTITDPEWWTSRIAIPRTGTEFSWPRSGRSRRARPGAGTGWRNEAPGARRSSPRTAPRSRGGRASRRAARSASRGASSVACGRTRDLALDAMALGRWPHRREDYLLRSTRPR